MIPRSVRNTLLIILIASTSISCKKNTANSPTLKGHANVSYFAKASGTGIKSVSTNKSNNVVSETAVVNWSTATIYVDKISFVGISNSVIDTTISVQKNINLLNPNALTGIIELPSGSYKDVKVKMHLRKNGWPEMAFLLKGTFTNTNGGQDSLLIVSSAPFEVNLGVPDITINPSEDYNVMFNFNLDKGLTGMSTATLQTADRNGGNGAPYVIWNGNSYPAVPLPLYDKIVENWQTVATATIIKK